MTLAHLHLVLNHVPTLGAVCALGLLLLAFVRRNDHLKHAGLEVLFAVAILTLPVYISGAAAHRELRQVPEVADAAIRTHQDVALAGFAVTEFAGFVAWIALWQTRRRRVTRGLVPAVMALLVVGIVVMGRAATLGGEVRHPEIRTGAAANAAAAAPEAVDERAKAEDLKARFVASAISDFIVNSRWASPAAETVHFLGMSLSIGVLLLVNLRILGVGRRQVTFADVHRWLPWGMLGFGANHVTGMLFFIAQPGQYLNPVFYWKVVFLMIAGANFLYLTVFTKAWVADGPGFRLLDKAMAVSSLVAWLAVLYAGRMLPFLGNSF